MMRLSLIYEFASAMLPLEHFGDGVQQSKAEQGSLVHSLEPTERFVALQD